MKRTPLYSAHRRAGAKMVEFAGWEMPVQYSGVIDEHHAVRTSAGLFDVSHMGELLVEGQDAVEFCQRVSANDVGRMKVGQAQYNLLLNDRAGVVDDVIFYRLEPNQFLICVNAANRDKDFEWLGEHAPAGVRLLNESDRYAQLALQGPSAERILQRLTDVKLDQIASFNFAIGEVASAHSLIARTGYTGEDGFELYCSPEKAEHLWNALLEAGEPIGLKPAGLGARDTLRLEKAYPLYGHELDDTTTPLEAGLEWVTKFSKPSFIGRELLVRQKENGVERRLVGFEMIDRGIARSGYPISKDAQPVGRVTSGTRSPTLASSIGLGYVDSGEAQVGNFLDVEIRGRKARARVVALPFYKKAK